MLFFSLAGPDPYLTADSIIGFGSQGEPVETKNPWILKSRSLKFTDSEKDTKFVRLNSLERAQVSKNKCLLFIYNATQLIDWLFYIDRRKGRVFAALLPTILGATTTARGR
jgi:hypothetical protein